MIKEKIEMELKPLEKMCDEVQSKLEEMIKSSEEVHYEAVLATAKTLGVLSDIEKDKVEKMYKIQIMEAMEESDYGEDYDEDGPVMRKGYRGQPRDSRGRYTSRSYTMTPEMYRNNGAEYYRDMDRKNSNVMYYTEMPNISKGNNSQSFYDNAKRMYTDNKRMYSNNANEDIQKNTQNLDEYLKIIADDITSMVSNMTPSEKTLLKTRLKNIEEKIQ